MRRLSLNARLAHDAVATDEVEVMLVIIRHPSIDEPVRLSTDPTERLSSDPLTYGTRSAWQTTDGSPFLFALITSTFPSDQEDRPASANLTFENVDNDIAKLLRGFTDRATMDIAVVLASSPDHVEAEMRGLKLMVSEGDAGEVTLHFSRDPISAEPYPKDRMTRQRFPGLHK